MFESTAEEALFVAAPEFEEIHSKQIMNRVDVAQMPFDWSVNPYRGCTHGCSFCYARATHSFLGMTPDDTFQNHILLKANAAEILDSQLRKMAKRLDYDLDSLSRSIGLLAIGTATDPYQPIEARRKITRSCLEVLARYRVPVTVTTRSPLILRDLDLLTTMDIRSVNISVNTLNKDVWRNLEPATPAPIKRLEAVKELVHNGIHAGILLAPIIPFLTDSVAELDEVLHAADAHNVRFVIPSVLRLSPDVKSWFMKTVAKQYPAISSDLNRLYRGTYPSASYQDMVKRRAKRLMAKYSFGTGAAQQFVAKDYGDEVLAESFSFPRQLVLPI